MRTVTDNSTAVDANAQVAARIRSLRTDAGLSLTELANKAGVSKSYLSTVEAASGKRPGAEVLFKVAAALGVTLADLLGRQVAAVREDEMPPSLAEFARDRQLPTSDVEMLAGIAFRGERPRTAQRWAFIYDAIAMSAQIDR